MNDASYKCCAQREHGVGHWACQGVMRYVRMTWDEFWDDVELFACTKCGRIAYNKLGDVQ